MISAKCHRPERGRHDVIHESARDHCVGFRLRAHRRFIDFLLPDAAGMHVGLMGQIHEVVDHQPVIAVDMVEAATVRPIRTLGPFEMVKLRWIRARGVARPDPDEAVTLHDREVSNCRKAAHSLAGHRHGLAVATHVEPMIAADEHAFDDSPERERGAAMGTEVLHRGNCPVGTAKEDNWLAADRPAQRFGVDFLRHAGDIPGVFRERHGSLQLQQDRHRIAQQAVAIRRPSLLE